MDEGAQLLFGTIAAGIHIALKGIGIAGNQALGR
jgi:hypothetical protein